MKACTKCKTEYPATSEFFYPAKGFKNGLRSDCRQCSLKKGKKYYQENRESCLQKGKRYYQENQEQCKGSHKRYYYANHKMSLQRGKRYYSTIHGYLKRIYNGMKRRCTNSNVHNYERYGGRGIECRFTSDEFRDYVTNVLKVDPRGLQIDRINNNGNYEPGNIRFVTAKENCNNRRKRITV